MWPSSAGTPLPNPMSSSVVTRRAGSMKRAALDDLDGSVDVAKRVKASPPSNVFMIVPLCLPARPRTWQWHGLGVLCGGCIARPGPDFHQVTPLCDLCLLCSCSVVAPWARDHPRAGHRSIFE